MAFVAVGIGSASAHEMGCDGKPVPERIKSDCCDEADEHQLVADQISRGPNSEYIVSIEGYRFIIPAENARPSHDSRSHIFFPNMWVVSDDGNQVRDPIEPKVRCFLTPLDF
jgi:hypothetical protein